MHPILFKIGFLTVYSYGVMLAAAVMACTFLAQKDAKRFGLDITVVTDLIFWAVLSGIAGGRIFYILLNLSFFKENPSEIIMLQHGGLAWQGALILGTIVGLIFIKFKKMPLGKTLDFAAPYIALGQSIGRVGCFLNGCCYGKKAPWGIYFPAHEARLHPTQLYDSFGLLLIFLFLKYYQKVSKVEGEVFIMYLLLAPFLRFIVEFFRADHTEAAAGLSIFQIICLCLIALAIYGRTLLHRRQRA